MFNDLKILEQIERFSKKSINLKFINETTTIFNSKIGGLPYLPLSMEYPKSKVDNKPFRFLSQINFEELPYIEDFTQKGILQFFLKEDENLGCNFKLNGKDDIKIIYHKEIIKDKTKLYSDLSNIKFNNKYLPFKLNYERKLKGVLENSYYSDLFSDKIINYISKNKKHINKMCFKHIEEMGLNFYEALELN